VALGAAILVNGAGERTTAPVYEYSAEHGGMIFRPIAIPDPPAQMFIELRATGIRGGEGHVLTVGGVEIPVIAVRPDPELAGVDVIEAGPLPAVLKEKPGEVPVQVSVWGKASNTVRIGVF